MFGSRVGFSGSAERMALFPVTSNPSWRQAAILDNFECSYLRNDSFDPLIAHISRLCQGFRQVLRFRVCSKTAGGRYGKVLEVGG